MFYYISIHQGSRQYNEVEMLAVSHSGVRLVRREANQQQDYLHVVENFGFVWSFFISYIAWLSGSDAKFVYLQLGWPGRRCSSPLEPAATCSSVRSQDPALHSPGGADFCHGPFLCQRGRQGESKICASLLLFYFLLFRLHVIICCQTILDQETEATSQHQTFKKILSLTFEMIYDCVISLDLKLSINWSMSSLYYPAPDDGNVAERSRLLLPVSLSLQRKCLVWICYSRERYFIF